MEILQRTIRLLPGLFPENMAGVTKYRHALTRSLAIFIILSSGHTVCSQDIGALADQKPFSINGSLGASLLFYDVDGREANRERFTWLLRGNPVMSVYGVTLPFSFTVSEQQRDFRQPFNQFGVSPYYKWITLHAGYRNIQYSNFSMAGHTILGGGFDLRPGRFRLSAIYGRLLKAVPFGARDNRGFFQIPSFKRMGGSVRIGYGTDDNFFDVIVLKGSDELKSLDSIPAESELVPQENLVVSLVTHQRFLKHWQVDVEYAQCANTKDFRYENTDNEGGLFLTKPLSFMMDEKPTTEHAAALEASAGYQGNVFGMKAHFKHIEPGFQSMGAYFFQNDLQNITLEPSLVLWQSKLNLSGSIGWQHDNLKDNLPVTTKRTITSGNLSVRPFQPYTATLSYSNYDIGQQAPVAFFDTIPQLSQATRNLTVTNNLSLVGRKFMHNVLATYTDQNLTDRNDLTDNFTEYTTVMAMGSYTLSFLPLQLAGTFTYTYTTFDGGGNTSQVQGPTVTLSKSFKNKVTVSASESILDNTVNNVQTRTISRLSVNAGVTVGKKQHINLRFYLNESTGESSGQDSFTEQKGEINYVYRFQ